MNVGRRKNQGFLSLLAVLLILVVGFIGLAFTYMMVTSFRSTSDAVQATQAFYLAESGLQQGIHQLLNSTLTQRSACSSLSLSNSLGRGTYSLSSAGRFYSNAASLNGSLTSTATTITVGSTGGYASSGRIMIDNELINYAGMDASHFLGATRGVDSSTAAAHATGTGVGQYQCTLASQGGVPSLSSPANPGSPFGKRNLQEAVQLQEGWAVGNQTSNGLAFARWNNPTEVQWNNATVVSSWRPNLTAICMLSYADGWAVGQNSGSTYTLLHWDGNAWSAVSVSGGSDLNDIDCNSSTDCWAVGQVNKKNPTILHFDGSSWSSVTPTVQANASANGVYCLNSSDCWLVGTALSNYPLLEHFDGVAWSRFTPSAQANTQLNSVYCNTSNDCWAVGNVLTGNPLIEYFNGSTWSRITPAASANSNLNSVYCNASNDCWAVGQHLTGNFLFILHWNGSNWSTTSSISNSNDLYDVSCTISSDCWAVGQNALFVHWDGSSWSVVSAPSGFQSNVTVNGISLLGPHTKPQAAWQEIFA